MSSSKKNTKKIKSSNETQSETLVNSTINGAAAKKTDVNVQNIWDLVVLEKFLRLLHE